MSVLLEYHVHIKEPETNEGNPQTQVSESSCPALPQARSSSPYTVPPSHIYDNPQWKIPHLVAQAPSHLVSIQFCQTLRHCFLNMCEPLKKTDEETAIYKPYKKPKSNLTYIYKQSNHQP